jgi:hypothetical protein
VRVNWGDAAVKLTPMPSLGVTEQRDLPAMMNAIAALQRAGYLHPSQQAGIDDDLNLPSRDMTQDAEPTMAEPQQQRMPTRRRPTPASPSTTARRPAGAVRRPAGCRSARTSATRQQRRQPAQRGGSVRALEIAASVPWAIRPEALRAILAIAAREDISREVVAAAMRRFA